MIYLDVVEIICHLHRDWYFVCYVHCCEAGDVAILTHCHSYWMMNNATIDGESVHLCLVPLQRDSFCRFNLFVVAVAMCVL